MTISPDIIAAAEKVNDLLTHYYYDRQTNIKAIAAAIAAERERCAKIAEDLPRGTNNPWAWPMRIAAAIRKD